MEKEELEPSGIILGEPNEVYHSRKAVSNSKLKVAGQSLELYKEKYMVSSVPEPVSPALNIGSRAHTYILEGMKGLQEEVEVLPKGYNVNLNTNIGKDRYKESFLSHHSMSDNEKNLAVEIVDSPKRTPDQKKQLTRLFNKCFLTYDDFKLIRDMNRSVRANPKAAALLDGCRPEVTFRTGLTRYGFQMQCRLDAHNIEGNARSDGLPFGLDIKTIDDLDAFENRYYNFGYYRQGPFYSAVVNAVGDCDPMRRFYFVFIEKKEPFRCRVFEPDNESWEYGSDCARQDLQKLSSAYEGSIPWQDSYSEVVGLKPWHKKELDIYLGRD